MNVTAKLLVTCHDNDEEGRSWKWNLLEKKR